jgi:hypothetical protein
VLDKIEEGRMMTKGWALMWPALGAATMALSLMQRMSYRGYEVCVRLTREGAVAEVRDGSGLVYTTHGYTEVEALDRAKTWVDELAESLPAYDLHAG